MSPFIILFLSICLTWAVFQKVRSEKAEKSLYFIFVAVLCFFCALRYCQGSDYISYKNTFLACSTLEMAWNNPSQVNSQVGFRILCSIFNGNYEIMIACIAVFSVLMMVKGINRFSPDRFLSLILAYPTIYMTYQFSVIREGIVISVFIGILLQWLEEKKWCRYYITVFLLTTIHSVALLYIIAPLIIQFKKKIILILPALSFGIGLVFMLIGGDLLSQIPFIGYSLAYYASDTVSYFALIERVLSYLLVLFLYLDERNLNERVENLLRIYMIGVMMYMLIFPFALIASRTCVLFKCVEILLVPILLEGKAKRVCQLATVVFLTLSFVLTLKNIGSYLVQLHYKSNVSIMNYPYISILNKQKVTEYQDLDERYLGIY